MTEKTVQVYFCDHCNAYYLFKKNIARHEKICKDNPKNQYACKGCIYNKPEGKSFVRCTLEGDVFIKPVAKHYVLNHSKFGECPKNCRFFLAIDPNQEASEVKLSTDSPEYKLFEQAIKNHEQNAK